MKKGAYDLGRKSVYYIVVVIIVAILFIYMTNSFRKYQVTQLSNLNEVTDLVMINNIMKCVSQKDPDTGRIYFGKLNEALLEKDSLINCLGKNKPYTDKSIKLEIGNKKIITQKPFFDYSNYERTVEYDGKTEKLKIGIEKYPQIS